MSTRVVVSVPKPNHLRARVYIHGRDNDGNWRDSTDIRVIGQGESADFLVYGSQMLRIEEVE